MRAFIFILALGVIGYFGYNHFVKPLTGEEQEVQAIKKKFDAAVEEFLQASRQAGGLGMDTVSDTDEAVRRVRSAKTALTNVQRRLKDKKAIQKAKELEAEMRNFFSKNELIWF
jgi:hypothetical protein